jgi:hypothetical protein
MYGFASAGVQTTLIHALLKAHSKSQPGHLLAYEAWGRLKKSGKQLDAQALLAGGWTGAEVVQHCALHIVCCCCTLLACFTPSVSTGLHGAACVAF